MDRISLSIAVLALLVSGVGFVYTNMSVSALSQDLSAQLQGVTKELKQTSGQLGAAQSDLEKTRKQLEEATAPQRVIDAAKNERAVVVYGTTDTVDMLGTIFPRFQAQYPWAEIKYVEGFTSLYRRFVDENKANLPSADVVIPNGPMEKEIYEGGFAKSQAKHPCRDLYPKDLLPWDTAMPYSGNLLGVMFNTNLVKAADAPKSFVDLVDPKWKGSVAMQGPTSGAAEVYTDYSEVLGKQKYEEFIRKLLIDNKPLLTGSGSDAVLKVVTGEAKVGWAYSADVVRQQLNKAPISMNFGNPTFTALRHVGVNVRAQHPNLGQLFVDWLSCAGGQLAIAQTGRNVPMPTVTAVVGPSTADLVKQGITVKIAGSTYSKDPDMWLNFYKSLGV